MNNDPVITYTNESALAKRWSLIYYLLLVLVIVDRTNALFEFAFVYTDSDQTLIWLATKDLADGRFYGPCFYGQSYNPLIEPILAIPLVIAGMEYHIALPLVTASLAIIPFICLAFYFKKKYGIIYGCIPFLVLLFLSPDYAMLTSMPRGFVTGMFLGIPGLLSLLRDRKINDLVGGILIALSVFVNPATILIFPLAIPNLINGKRSLKNRILFIFLGLAIGAMAQLLNSNYYSAHPELVVHPSPDKGFSLKAFGYIFTHLHVYFDAVTPVLWRAGFLSLFVLIFFLFKFKKENKKWYSYTTAIILTLILVSFFSNKVSDGRDSVYFSGARMFLAYPVILIFTFLWYLQLINNKTRNRILNIGCGAAVVIFVIKIAFFDQFNRLQLKDKNSTVVGTIKIDDLRSTCNEMLRFSNGSTDLVVSNSPNSSDQLINYGCGCLVKDFPPTLQPEYDRRTWQIQDILDNKYQTVLVFGEEIRAYDSIDRSSISIIKEDQLKHWILVNNTKSTRDLLINMNILP